LRFNQPFSGCSGIEKPYPVNEIGCCLCHRHATICQLLPYVNFALSPSSLIWPCGPAVN
jgi:hypothetical protein